MIQIAFVLDAALAAAPASRSGVASSDPADYPDAPEQEEAVAFRGACHRFRISAQQRLTRAQWDESMKSMVQRHNMPKLDKEELDSNTWRARASDSSRCFLV